MPSVTIFELLVPLIIAITSIIFFVYLTIRTEIPSTNPMAAMRIAFIIIPFIACTWLMSVPYTYTEIILSTSEESLLIYDETGLLTQTHLTNATDTIPIILPPSGYSPITLFFSLFSSLLLLWIFYNLIIMIIQLRINRI